MSRDTEDPELPRPELGWLRENVDEEFSPCTAGAFRRARRIERLNVVLTVLSVVLLGSVLGGSQAMKSAWVDDAASLIPPICALAVLRLERRAAPRTGCIPSASSA